MGYNRSFMEYYLFRLHNAVCACVTYCEMTRNSPICSQDLCHVMFIHTIFSGFKLRRSDHHCGRISLFTRAVRRQFQCVDRPDGNGHPRRTLRTISVQNSRNFYNRVCNTVDRNHHVCTEKIWDFIGCSKINCP